MGLDINFYKSMKKVTPPKDVDDLQEWAEEQDYIYISPNVVEYQALHFAHIAALTAGVYEVEYVSDVPARAYSAYNRWRNELAQYAGYGSAENVWNNYDKGDFYELIHFSDCEGFLVGETVAKLREDFSKNRERIFSLVPEGMNGDHFRGYYDKFLKGLNSIYDQSPMVYFL